MNIIKLIMKYVHAVKTKFRQPTVIQGKKYIYAYKKKQLYYSGFSSSIQHKYVIIGTLNFKKCRPSGGTF